MGEMIEYTRPDGKLADGYLSSPAGTGGAPGVVVLQEWWGIRAKKSHSPHTADRLAAAGFRALAPDLYHGRTAANADEAQALMNALDGSQALDQDIRGALQYLRASGSKKTGVIGFCMGGAYAILSAIHFPETDAAVVFYGIPPARAGDPSTIKVPLQAHYAEQDDWCSPAAVSALEAKWKAGGVRYELHRYDAQHAFMNHNRPEVHDPKAAALAWDRALQFLRSHIA